MEQWREDVLIHYGIKGMKWGARFKGTPIGTLPKKKTPIDGIKKRKSNDIVKGLTGAGRMISKRKRVIDKVRSKFGITL